MLGKIGNRGLEWVDRHGGKFTWVGDGYSQAEIGFEKEAVDVKDPS